MGYELDHLLRLMNDRGASDLHLSVGRAPALRRSGQLEWLRYEVLTEQGLREMLRPIAPEPLWEVFKAQGAVDFAYSLPGVCRFRVSLLEQQRGMGAIFREIPREVMGIAQLSLPVLVERLTLPTEGLILITGPNGSGRSTTLAAILDTINRQRPVHILTLEDPIEFVHTGQRALISQREIGLHARDLAEGIRAAMREDPDVIVVGHPKQAEEFELLLRAAEAGRLVFAMLDTAGAVRTIERIIYSFPADRHETLRSVLAGVLRGVLCQHLLQRSKGGRVPAIELLLASPSVASVIREWKLAQLAGLMSVSQGSGMQTMDDSLRMLLERNEVAVVEALEAAQDREELKRWLIGQRRALPEE